MAAPLFALLAALRSTLRTRLELKAEILALGHQLAVLQRQTPHRPRLRNLDKVPWSSFNLTTQTLPTSGTYTIVIDPSGANTGSISVAVTNP